MKTLPFQTKCLRATETDSRMQRLQMAAEISEKAASEMVEQKMTELMTSQRRIESLLAECEHLKSELQESNEKNGKLHHNNTQLVAEKAELRESFREMLLDWEEQEDDSKRAAVKTANLREQTQRLTLENRRLRQDRQPVLALSCNFCLCIFQKGDRRAHQFISWQAKRFPGEGT
eukprot:GHVN01013834.1.p2 GENE.GHVN01013834.1~~GHVN01013834.1.p2  ORF type:complete len:175 (+),score=23.47 GHVN01013834.1:1109-1633(+)